MNKNNNPPTSKEKNEEVEATSALVSAKAEEKDSTTATSLSPPLNSVSSGQKLDKGPGWFVMIVVFLLALMAAAGSAFVWQSNQQQQQARLQLHSDIKVAIKKMDAQAGEKRVLQRELDKLTTADQVYRVAQQKTVDDLQRQLHRQSKQLQSLSTTDREDWLLAEAEYLMLLGNQRLLMGKEIKGAESLLKAADEIIRELDDSALYPVRQALAGDLVALQTANKLDIEGIYLQLEALAKETEELRLFEMPALPQVNYQAPKNVEGWQQSFDASLRAALDKLSTYIQINRRDDIYKPLLSPEYEPAVRQNLRLMFEQAQMALLANKQELYQRSLQKAADWLNDYYTLDSERTTVVLKAVKVLQAKQITVVLPDISASRRALKDYMDRIHNLPVRNKEGGN